MHVQVTRSTQSRLSSVDFKHLGFGVDFADHMMFSRYHSGTWEAPAIMPYGNLSLPPAMLALHYGQAVFEGMKAFRMKDGRISVFRPLRHQQRLNKSLERMCMPAITEDLFMSGLETLLRTDNEWVPQANGASLYIRPFVFATEARLGVKVSDEYYFIIITSPVGPYFSKPVRLKVEEQYVRVAEGGPGNAKCAGNYGAAFYPSEQALKEGFDQVLWTDAAHHEYIDECGAMNVMFVIDGILVTPAITTSILEGITRDSILTLADDMGMIKEVRKVSVKEVKHAFEKGSLTEAFGVGTAAIVSEVSEINIHGKNYVLPPATPQSFQTRVKDRIVAIRDGSAPDTHGWNHIIV